MIFKREMKDESYRKRTTPVRDFVDSQVGQIDPPYNIILCQHGNDL